MSDEETSIEVLLASEQKAKSVKYCHINAYSYLLSYSPQAKTRTWYQRLVYSTKTVLLGSKLNVLLFAVVFACLFDALAMESPTFVFSLIALVPLAEVSIDDHMCEV